METMNIALPEGMKQFVQDQVQKGGYSSVSEYIRDLIRADQKEKAHRALETEILKGIQSGESSAMTRKEWAAIRKRVGNVAG